MVPKTQRAKLVLPVSVIGPVEVGRLIRELEKIDEYLLQSSLREAEHPADLPRISQLLDDLVEANNLHLNRKIERSWLSKYLKAIKKKAPVVHMSFAADPASSFTDRIMEWLRREIHPFCLLTIGLQPNIGAGCVLRTTNKYFDMSLKQHLVNQRPLLLKLITEATEQSR